MSAVLYCHKPGKNLSISCCNMRVCPPVINFDKAFSLKSSSLFNGFVYPSRPALWSITNRLSYFLFSWSFWLVGLTWVFDQHIQSSSSLWCQMRCDAHLCKSRHCHVLRVWGFIHNQTQLSGSERESDLITHFLCEHDKHVYKYDQEACLMIQPYMCGNN